LAEHPLASSPRFIDPTGGRCVPLPFKQVQYLIHPLGGESPVLPEILEGLHLASQRLRSRTQSPMQAAPAIRQGLAPAGGARRVRAPQSCFFLPGIASLTRKPECPEIIQGIGPPSHPRHACCFVRSTRPRGPRGSSHPSSNPITRKKYVLGCALKLKQDRMPLLAEAQIRTGAQYPYAPHTEPQGARRRYEPRLVQKEPSRMPLSGGLVRTPTEAHGTRASTSYKSYTSYKNACGAPPAPRAQPQTRQWQVAQSRPEAVRTG
jgi:hypothetical protein